MTTKFQQASGNLKKIFEGNKRFSKNSKQSKTVRPEDLAQGQSPETIVITCSDSRVAPEIVFDHDLGELFVIRTAGNTASIETVASAEFAISILGSKNLLVLGHSGCGAIGAAVNRKKTGQKLPSDALEILADEIQKNIPEDCYDLREAMLQNVKGTLRKLLDKSSILQSAARDGKLNLFGAWYDVNSGSIELIEKY